METQEAMSYFVSYGAPYYLKIGLFGANIWDGDEALFGIIRFLSLPVGQLFFITPCCTAAASLCDCSVYAKDKQLFCWYANCFYITATKSNCFFPITVINWNFLACPVNSDLIVFCHRNMHSPGCLGEHNSSRNFVWMRHKTHLYYNLGSWKQRRELELTETQLQKEDWRSQAAALLFGGKIENHQSYISTSSILLSAPRSEASSLP